MTNKKFLISMAVVSFLFVNSASAAILPGRDIISPDSSFYFLQTWKESIQTFFTFGAENKAKQYLHLADVRLDEYKKMIEKGKTEIAQKTLDKYEKQLNQALNKTEELKNKGKDVKDLSQKIEEAVSKHLKVLQENLQKVPEQARKGIENAIENSQKHLEKISELKSKKRDENEVCAQVETPAKDPKTGECKVFLTPCDVPDGWTPVANYCLEEEEIPILEELEKLNIQVIGQPKQIELQLPSVLTGSNWGLKKAVCEEGGYDLSSFAGKAVLLTSYPIGEKYKNEPLDVWVISSGDKIACVYKAVREGSVLTPGVFPVEEKCVSVGEEMSPKEYGQGDRCCVGLTQIKTSRYFYPCDNPGKNACDENGCSIPPPTSDESPWWQCAPCGNGKCESAYGENKCNCSKDCK